MVTIYLDVLLVLNIYVNFFLLRMTARFTRSRLKNSRCIAASAAGSLFSLLILAPPLPSLINTAVKLVSAAIITAAAFGLKGKRQFIICTTAFLASNLILAGAVFGVYTWLKPDFIHIGNSFFYIDFSLLVLLITTAALYFIVFITRQFTDRTPPDNGCYRIIIRTRNSLITLPGIADTGNSLVDYFTGVPVIVCDTALFGDIDLNRLPKGYRLLPCSTISESSFIPIFRPEEVLIANTSSGERFAVDAMIGLGKVSGKAVFNPKLLDQR